MFKFFTSQKETQKTREIDGKTYKVMDWGVTEDPDKTWALSGFERETPMSARKNGVN